MYGDNAQSTIYLTNDVIEAFNFLRSFFEDVNNYAISMLQREDLPQRNYFSYEFDRNNNILWEEESFNSVLKTLLLRLAMIDGVYSIKEASFIDGIYKILPRQEKVIYLNPLYKTKGLFSRIHTLQAEQQDEYVEQMIYGTVQKRGVLFYQGCGAYDFFINNHYEFGFLPRVFEYTRTICKFFLELDGTPSDFEYDAFVQSFDILISQPWIKVVHELERKIK